MYMMVYSKELDIIGMYDYTFDRPGFVCFGTNNDAFVVRDTDIVFLGHL